MSGLTIAVHGLIILETHFLIHGAVLCRIVSLWAMPMPMPHLVSLKESKYDILLFFFKFLLKSLATCVNINTVETDE